MCRTKPDTICKHVSNKGTTTTRTSPKTVGDLRYPGRVSRSCSTGGTCRVAHVTTKYVFEVSANRVIIEAVNDIGQRI